MDALRCGFAGRLRGTPQLLTAVLTLVAALLTSPPSAASAKGYQYLSPSPGSRLVSPWNNIVIRPGSVLDAGAFSSADISVVGSRSGIHPGRLVLSDDSKTLVFVPTEPFAPGETVVVKLAGGRTSAAGERLPPLTFDFSIARAEWKLAPRPGREWLSEESLPEVLSSSMAPASSPASLKLAASQPCDTMPSFYTSFTVIASDNPDPGLVFMTPRSATTWGLAIVDNLGNPVYFNGVPLRPIDFSLQQGLLTYYAGGVYWALNSSYALVDSFKMGNGYTTDQHEMRLLPNGRALLMSYDPQPVDMSTVVPGGNPNASVTGLIIQEIDAAKNVVFQWRSWDYFQITDMVEVPGRSLTDAVIDYAHGNAIESDADGNILISSRHMNEITKIDRQTGDIIWRLGLNSKNNQFTFVNDTRGFSCQHDIRRLPNGHITLFDNGNFLSPEYSRALEYSLDEQNKVATFVWEYREMPDIFGSATGSVRRAASGGTIIGWGRTAAADPRVTDLHADGSKALEFGFNSTTSFSYRAVRYPWQTTLFVPGVTALNFGTVRLGNVATLPLSIHNNSTSALELTCFVSTDASFSVADPVPVSVPAGGNASVNVRFAPASGGSLGGKLYVRSVHGQVLVAQVVDVSGIGDSVSGVGGGPGAGPWLAVYPSPGRGTRTLAFAMATAGRAVLQIYDTRGRLVATPFAGVTTAGLHEVAWNGRSEAGTAVSSGLYFARFTSTSGTRILKLVNMLD